MKRIGGWRAAWMLGTLAALITLQAAPAAQAQVREELIVDVRVDAGPRPRQPESRVLNEGGLRKGQVYTPFAVQEAVRKLENTHWFYSVFAKEERTRDGVVITYVCSERRLIEDISYDGCKHLTRKELDAITGLRRGSPMHPALNTAAKEAILFELHKQGRFQAEVRLLEGGEPDDRRVAFQITEGPVVRIRDIRVEGNSGELASDARLKVIIDSRERFAGLFGGKFRPELIEADRLKLIEYYKNFGYFDCKINRQIIWNSGHETVDVVYVVDEGPRFRVKEVQLAGAKVLDSDLLMSHNLAKKGEFYNGAAVNKGVKAMQDEYGKRGFVTAKVNKSVNFHKGEDVVTVAYQVVQERNEPARVGEIHSYGNTTTRKRIIDRELAYAGVLPGQILDTVALQRAEARLRNLNIFKFDPANGIMPSIEVLDPDSPDAFKDLGVFVAEDRTGSLLFGVGISSDAGASASISLHERNFDILRPPHSIDDILNNRAFRGAGQEFRAEVVPGTEVSRYVVSWRDPHIFDTPYSLGLSAYYYTRQYDGYDDQRVGGRVSIGRRFNNLWSAELSTRIEDINIHDISPFAPPAISDFAGSHFAIGPRIGVVRDSTDFFLRPTAGNKFKMSYEQVFGSYTYPTVTLEDTQYFTLRERPDGSGRHVLSVRGQAAVTYNSTPVYDRLYAGGFSSMRGFEFRGVGPRENGFPTGGSFLLTGSVEYQIPLLASDALYGVLFSDFGTVENNVEIQNFRVSAGFGFRITIPAFGPAPIALDFGFPIVKAPFDETQVFSFTIGLSR